MDKLIKYDNGLRVVVENIPNLHSVVMGIWVGMGSSKETSDINGLSHFTEHMMFKGTNKFSPQQIAEEFETLGARINAFTGKETTCYYLKTIDEQAEKCFDLLSHICFESIFPEDELDRERKVIVEEINMVEDSPEDICYDILAGKIYENSPIGQTILGPIENVNRFKKADVDNFINKNYCANNIVVSFAGNITLKQADNLIKKYVLNKISKHKTVTNFADKIVPSKGHIQRIKEFEQSNIAISFPSIEFNNKLSSTQAILNVILGGSMSSRLFQSIRERLGLAYSVYSAPSAFKNNGTFNIILNISARNTQKALDAVKSELKILLDKGIDQKEFDRAKTQIKSTLIFGQENTQTVMSSLGKLLIMSDEVYDFDNKIKEINSVNLKDVEEFSKKIFTQKNIVTAYVGKDSGVDFTKFEL